MWDKLREQVQLELEQLNLLLRTHDELLRKSARAAPDSTELSALAALLHSFYTGIENIFKRICVEIDSDPPAGEFWHQRVLDAMTKATGARRTVISPALRTRLKEYLQFRHVFRHAYTFQLQWERMSPLVLGCNETLELLEAELGEFLRAAPPSPKA